jgi:hypothetical protein
VAAKDWATTHHRMSALAHLLVLEMKKAPSGAFGFVDVSEELRAA